MHELALADAVVATALKVAEAEGISRITRVAVRIGELQRIDPEVFRFALKEILPRDEPRLAEAEIALEVVPARFRCRACETSFSLGDTAGPAEHDQAEAIHFIPELAHAFLECPHCQSPDFELLEGRGVTIESLEGE